MKTHVRRIVLVAAVAISLGTLVSSVYRLRLVPHFQLALCPLQWCTTSRKATSMVTGSS
jgi:hypothetical protein